MASSTRPQSARRVVRLTRRGIVTGAVGIVIVVAAYSVHRTELLFLGWFALLLPASAVLFVTLRRVRFEVKRSFSRSMLVAGQIADGQLELRNLSPRASVDARWRETVPWGPPASGGGLARMEGRTAWGQESRIVHYQFVPPRRGRFLVGPMVVELSDPFSLATGEIPVGGTNLITVIPELEHLRPSELAVTADDGSARALRLRALGGDDDTMTRSYRTGDALRRVHWRASAHHGELMVREEEQRSHAEARIVLDTTMRGYRDRHGAWQPRAGRDAQLQQGRPESELFEWTLKLAATLALHLEQRGFLVQLTETGPRHLTSPDRVDEFLESVASIGLAARADPLGMLARRDARPDRSLGVVFAVIADADPAIVESLATQRAQFGLAVVFLAAAHSDDVPQRLASAGWHCVIAPPGGSVLALWESIAPLLEASRARR